MNKEEQRKSRALTLRSNCGWFNVISTKCGISESSTSKSKYPRPSIECDAVWDTGATGSCISKKIAAELALKATGMCEASTAGGVCTVNTYLINIHLPNGVTFQDVVVTDADMGNTEMLIGMDIISQGDFAITNYNGNTTFTFQIPSTHDIDFVQEHKDLHRPTQPIVKDKLPGRNDPCHCGNGKKYKNCHGK